MTDSAWQKIEGIELGPGRTGEGEWKVTEDDVEVILHVRANGKNWDIWLTSAQQHPDIYLDLAEPLIKGMY